MVWHGPTDHLCFLYFLIFSYLSWHQTRTHSLFLSLSLPLPRNERVLVGWLAQAFRLLGPVLAKGHHGLIRLLENGGPLMQLEPFRQETRDLARVLAYARLDAGVQTSGLLRPGQGQGLWGEVRAGVRLCLPACVAD